MHDRVTAVTSDLADLVMVMLLALMFLMLSCCFLAVLGAPTCGGDRPTRCGGLQQLTAELTSMRIADQETQHRATMLAEVQVTVRWLEERLQSAKEWEMLAAKNRRDQSPCRVAYGWQAASAVATGFHQQWFLAFCRNCCPGQLFF